MVILNNEILMCKNTLTKSIKNIMQSVMEKYFDEECYYENKKKIMQNIIKEKIDKVKDNHFWYENSSENVCTFIHKRGKKDGYMCHKKINTNLAGQKKDYLCCTHSKLHIPKKRNRLPLEKITKKYIYKKKLVRIKYEQKKYLYVTVVYLI